MGRADDRAERQADDVAARVIESLRTLRRPAVVDSPRDGGRVRRKPSPSAREDPAAGGLLDEGTAGRIRPAMGGGRPLPPPVREPMEAAFGASLDRVRIHAGPEAADLSASIDARAFALGRDVFFGRGQYRPEHPSGQHLLAHEVAHTLQQPAGADDSAPSVIHRKMAFTGTDLHGSDKVTSALRAGFGDLTTWNEIRSLLKAYAGAKTPAAELRLLLRLEVLGHEWLTSHPDRISANEQRRADSIDRLIASCEAEIALLGAEQDDLYSERMGDTNAAIASGAKGKVSDERFRYVTASGAKGLDVANYGNLRAKPELAGSTLTDAEIAAIRLYTGGDYRSMNPLLEGSDAWLAGNVTSLTNKVETSFALPRTQSKMEKAGGAAKRNRRRDLKVEAGQHARLAISGLKKLPDVHAAGYRGFTIPKAELDAKYQVGSAIVYKPFTSTSTKRDMSRGYASVPQPGKVGVLLELDITQGKDVKALSLAPGEGEVLLVPGASFTVSEAPKQEGAIWVVKLRQTGPGTVTPATLGPAVAANGPPVDDGDDAGSGAESTTEESLVAATVADADSTVSEGVSSTVVEDSAEASVATAVAHSLADVVASKSRSESTSASESGPGNAPMTTAPAPALTLPQLADAAAAQLIAAATTAEPAVTAALTNLAADNGGYLEGLDHRFKTKASLARKLVDRVRLRANPGDPAADMAIEAAKVNDALRYTMVVSPKTYGGASTGVQDSLRQLKYQLTNYWNAWDDPNSVAYKGINTTYRTATGLLFELQLHTEASFGAKQAIHDQYEEFRDADTTPARKAELAKQMGKRWTKVKVPAGAVPPKGKKKK